MDECVEGLEEAIEEAMQTDVDDIVPQLEEAVSMLKRRAYDWDDMSEILSGVIEQVSYEIDRCEYRASTLENTGRLPEYDAYIADQMYDAHRDRLILGMEY